ncbi:Phosphatidylserine decarboxylase [hydrothermal vent metagenome]|uniref:phosphatidylserine decarboxylase n=1 Tax=hydrothermal vent metagenome TaxID=652676 RepID=A0A3B0YQ35_9ZZZZ
MSRSQTNASNSDYLKSLPLYPLPHHAISRLTYRLARIQTPWFKNAFIRWFADTYKIDWSESLLQKPEDFKHFNAFFTRELQTGARPIEGDDNTVVSPADGHISQIGRIDQDAVFQAKGHSFSVTELLGGDSERAAAFLNGRFATVYLSPRDYHRVHMPFSGHLRETIYVPGRLFSVAGHTARTVPNLFARNERLVSIFDTDAGPMALVLVGAINVAAIETVWSGLVTPPHRSQVEVTDYRGDNIKLARGAEMGRFNMGSTAIVLFGDNAVDWLEPLQAEQSLRVGQALGHRQLQEKSHCSGHS